jgi:hypothetical protein
MTKRDSQLREYASEAADIVTRLRDRAYSFKAPDPLLEEAADEIERLRQFDRLQPIEPAAATPATHATPGDGSLQGEGTLPHSYRDNDEKRGVSDTKRGPVAWAILHLDQQYVSLLREMAEAHNVFAAPIVPLYRSPTLTNEEREAVEAAISSEYSRGAWHWADTLRSLLERLQ